MTRALILLFVIVASSIAATDESSTTPSFIQPKARSILCNSCLRIVGVINEVAIENTFREKQACEDLCNKQFGLSTPSGLACLQWLNGDIEMIQDKLKNGWSPSAICQDIKMCN